MLYSICLFAMALLFYGGHSQECNRCPSGFIHLQKQRKCYKVFPNIVTWDEAFNICNQLGAHLAVIKNPETNIALRMVFHPVRDLCPYGGYSAFWTAGRYACKNTPPFKWNTGNGNLWDIGYTNWRNGEPNSAGNEDCIQVYDDGTTYYGWNDVDCHLNKFCTICEIDI